MIAEAGVNHNGSVSLARQLIEVAAQAGADAVKFQIFKTDRLVTPTARKADYQRNATGGNDSQFEMLRGLELNEREFKELAVHAKEVGIDFLSTPFDSSSLNFLVGELGVERVKVPSGEVTNGPFLLEIARTRLPVILSTGMSLLGEVEEALAVLAFGYAVSETTPTPGTLVEAYRSVEGQEALNRNVVLLHCTSDYPTALADVNLRAMDSLRDAFDLPVGYSDHTQGIAVSVAAAARDAAVIEKHFTLDKDLPGPDHAASLDPTELSKLVGAVREVESALGSRVKAPVAKEAQTRVVARRSLIAASRIRRGDRFTPENVGILRPGNGLSPMRYWELLGEKAGGDFEPGELLE